MMKLAVGSLLATSLVLPVMAQTPASPSENHSSTLNAPANHDMATNPLAGGQSSASGRSTIMTDNGSLRASKIVGASVYNDHSLHAVLSVGGFLGIGSKMVEIPFDKLDFGNAKGSSDNRVVLPGSTKEQLTSMPDFQYTNRG
jgi:hypothetical protein